MCFVIATEYIGTFRWGKDGEIDNIFAQDSSHIGTIKKDYWGRENQNAYLEYDTSNTDYAFNKANSYLFKNGQNGYVGGAGEFSPWYPTNFISLLLLNIENPPSSP